MLIMSQYNCETRFFTIYLMKLETVGILWMKYFLIFYNRTWSSGKIVNSVQTNQYGKINNFTYIIIVKL